MLKTLGFVSGVLFWGEGVEGNRYCPSNKLLQRPLDQPPATPSGSKAGSKRRRVPEAPAQVHSSPTRPQVPGAGLPLLTGAQGGRLSRGNEGSGGEGRATTAVESSSSPRPPGLVLTPAREPRDRGGGGDPGQEKAGERGGERSPRSAQGEEWSTRAPEARRREAGSCVLWREGRGGRRRRRRRGEEGGREVTTGSPSAERTRPHVARVSSWTRTRTPEGPLRARSGSAGATEAAAPVRREQGPHPRLLSAAARAARREDLERPLHRDAPAAAAAWRRTGGGTCPRGMGPVPCFAAAAPPDLPHVLRF
ncbi:uncharacterized protein [Canis lupus baileyi]|uniref:uncharacterized protein n=1 Tax=Canis lupus baileyi TaxID=143281 RepID=UPI003B97614B